MNKNTGTVFGILGLALLGLGVWFFTTYNRLIALDEGVKTRWGDVQSNYQRRADLYSTQLPVVVAGSAQELAVFKELVKQAEALSAKLNYSSAPTGTDSQAVADQIAAFDAAVQSFNLYVADNPEIVSGQLYKDFMVAIEGTENRINVARRDYNEAVRVFRTAVRSFPGNLIAPSLGFSEDQYSYFEAQAGTQNAPVINFPTPSP